MIVGHIVFIVLLCCLKDVWGAAAPSINPAKSWVEGTLPVFRKSPKAVPWLNGSLSCGVNKVPDPTGPDVNSTMVLSCPAEGGKWAALKSPLSVPRGPASCYYTVYCIRDTTAQSGSICKSAASCLGGNERIVNYNSGSNRKLALSSIAPGAVRFTMDDKCDLGSNETDGFVEAGNTWVNYAMIENQNNSLTGFTDPSDGADLYVRGPVVADHATVPPQTIPGSDPYTFTPELVLNGELLKCNSRCNYGSALHFEVGQSTVFHASLYVKDTCEWIMVCQNTLTSGDEVSCDRAYASTLDFQNNLVMLAGDSVAVPVTIQPGRHTGHQNNFGQVDVTYDKDGRISVTTALRERVVAQNSRFSSGMIAFFLSDSSCLQYPVQGMGDGVAVIAGNDTAALVDTTAPPVAHTLPTVTAIYVPTIPTTTRDPNEQTAPPTTTEADDRQFTTYPGVITWASLLGRRQGWMTWAVFFGFFAGSFVGVLIVGLVFYLCRRSVFSEWYRGMYKRYHCDASGTTGGPTGAAFGKTTTAGVSTVGTTTAGTTAGTTTSGDTTTGGRSTGGTTTGGTTTGGTQTTVVSM